jgi:hypothetical protein
MIAVVDEKRDQTNQSYRENDAMQRVTCFYLNVSAIATLLALIPGMVVLAVYCKRMNVVEQYEYYGPMYISGYQTELYHWHNGGTCRYFHGQLHVSWGMEWGCPDYTDRWCSDVATDHDCTKDVCDYPDFLAAASQNTTSECEMSGQQVPSKILQIRASLAGQPVSHTTTADASSYYSSAPSDLYNWTRARPRSRFRLIALKISSPLALV